MKRFLGFVLFVIPWAEFILNLPDIVEKAGKWIPVLKYASAKLTNSVSALIGVLPRAPGCGTCLAFYWFWPTLAFMGLAAAACVLFWMGYARLSEPADDVAKPKVILSLLFVYFIILYLVQSWLLYRYSGLTFARSLAILTFEGRVQAAHDKNFFLHASNIYGLIIIVSYFSIILLVRWVWCIYVRNPEAKPPKLT